MAPASSSSSPAKASTDASSSSKRSSDTTTNNNNDNKNESISTPSEPVKKKPRTSSVIAKVTELPPVLASLTAKETKPLLVIETREVQSDHKDENFPMGSRHPMVVGVKIPGSASNNGKEEVFDLSQLKSETSRKFGQKMGIRNASKMKGEKIYFLMALRIKNNSGEGDDHTNASGGGGVETKTNIASASKLEPTHAETHQRHNTILRLINALFSKEFLPQFLVWKDVVVQRRGRVKEMAMENMNSSVKHLFQDVAKVLFANIDNPTSEGFGHLETFDNREDANLEVVYEYKSICKLGESPFVELEPKQLKDIATRLVKSRLLVLDTIKERSAPNSTSNHGSSSSSSKKDDPWLYVYEALKGTCSVRNVGKFPLYYFCLKAEGVTQFDSHLHSIGFKTSRPSPSSTTTRVIQPDSASNNNKPSARTSSSSSLARASLTSLANAAVEDARSIENGGDDASITAMSTTGEGGDTGGGGDGGESSEQAMILKAVSEVASSIKFWSKSSFWVNEEQRKLHQANWQLQQIEIRRQQGAEIDELHARLRTLQKDENLPGEVKERLVQRLTAQLEQKINTLYPTSIHSL